MNNKIEVFKNEQFGEVRTILEGETLLFCGSDIAKALGYARPGKAIIDHCKGVLKRDTLTSGGMQSLSYIPEGDVYRLIVHSKLPAAEKFEHWLFDEVVPTIRKTGGYMTDSLLERIQKEPAVIVEFAQALILEKNRVKALECELNTAKPKADYYDAFINPDDCTNIRTTAKELKIPERKFVQFLLREKYLFRSPSGQLLPYNKDSNAGLFIVRDFVTYCYTGSQTYFTPKGKDVIRMKFQKSAAKSCFPRWQGDFMAVFRVPKIENFTMMSNHHLRNKKLSLKAVGLMSKILSLPDEWDYSLKGLAKLNTDGIDGVRSAVQELEDAGYIIRRQRRDKNGRMAQSEYLVFEIPELSKPALDSPSSEKPIPVKPATDVPTSGNPMQINTNQVITHQENTHLNNTPSINHSGTGRRNDGIDWMDERERYREIIEENIEYEIMKDRPDGDRLGEIVEIMLDAVCSTAPTIRINGEDMPQQVVKSRFLKLDSSHIEYVFHAMKECPSNIRNIRAYLLTTLYNAPATMDNFYSAKVNHDFNGW